jgi:hypothetical protein
LRSERTYHERSAGYRDGSSGDITPDLVLGAATLDNSTCLESFTDFRVEHDIRLCSLSQPDPDITGDGSSWGLIVVNLAVAL